MGMEKEAKKVHLVDADGALIYTRILDDGGDVLRFEGGFGLLLRGDLRPGERLLEGWPLTQRDRARLGA